MIDELKKRTNLLDYSIDRTEQILYKEYIRIEKELELKLRKLYQDIKDDGDPLLSHLYQFNRYFELMNIIQEDLTKLGKYEKTILEDNLIKLYKDNNLIISNYGNNFTPFTNNNLVKEVVNSNWGGRAKTWSDSIWGNTREIADRIRSDMVDIITTGKSYKEVSTMLVNDLGIKFHQAQRLIRTEMARVAVQSTINKYAELGITKVKVITAHDDEVCSTECETHAGKIIPLLEAQIGINVPPFHPNCRCDIVAVWEEDNV